jgi:hypothetical protein
MRSLMKTFIVHTTHGNCTNIIFERCSLIELISEICVDEENCAMLGTRLCCQKKMKYQAAFEWDERKMWLKRRTHTGSVNLLKKKMEWIFSARWLLDVLSQIINHYKRHFITWLFFNTSTCHAKSLRKIVRSRSNTRKWMRCAISDGAKTDDAYFLFEL